MEASPPYSAISRCSSALLSMLRRVTSSGLKSAPCVHLSAVFVVLTFDHAAHPSSHRPITKLPATKASLHFCNCCVIDKNSRKLVLLVKLFCNKQWPVHDEPSFYILLGAFLPEMYIRL